MNERAYQAKLIRRINREFPGCLVIKNDASSIQGIPDLLILFRDKWAMLEIKISQSAPIQPNQEHYVEEFNEMSYCAFICPENEERVFDELQFSFGNSRQARIP